MADTIYADVPSDLTLDRPDMAHVKLTNAQPGHLEGEVLYLDILSARALVGRGDAEWFDPSTADPEEPVPISRQAGRANVQTMVVRSADLPVVAAGGDSTAVQEVIETGTGAGTVVDVEVPTSSSNKSDIVAYAEGKLKSADGTPLTTAELESKSKAALVAELKLD